VNAPPHRLLNPTHDGSNGIEIAGWRVAATKGRILNSTELDDWEHSLTVPCLPEMVFGHSALELKHEPSGLTLRFLVRDALREWKHDQPSLKVAYSNQWTSQRSSEARKVGPDYDWTFTTEYKGTLSGVAEGVDAAGSVVETEEKIDLDRLRVPEPMLFFDEVVLFEDELADNGGSFLSVKVRVMPGYFYALLRFYMRVDDVTMRIYDTRIFHEYGSSHLLREYQTREATYQQLAQQGKMPSDLSQLTDSNFVWTILPITGSSTHKILLSVPQPSASAPATDLEKGVAQLNLSS
jgi:type 2A phosphatase activator TIP41